MLPPHEKGGDYIYHIYYIYIYIQIKYVYVLYVYMICDVYLSLCREMSPPNEANMRMGQNL